MNNYAILYYCFADASPIDIWNNPIPSICSIRRLNKDVPIVILLGADNKHLFSAYEQALNIQIHQYIPKGDIYTQLTYKAQDVYDYLRSSKHYAGLLVDNDIIWHINPNDFVASIKLLTDKQIWLADRLNTGMFYITKDADIRFMRNWSALAHLFARYNNDEFALGIINSNYSGPYVHDESVLHILKNLLRDRVETNIIHYYPEEYAYTPQCGVFILPGFKNLKTMHYCRRPLEEYFKHLYSHHLWNRIGRIGAILGITEYKQWTQDILGSEAWKEFTRYIGFPFESIPVQKFINDWYNYVITH